MVVEDSVVVAVWPRNNLDLRWRKLGFQEGNFTVRNALVNYIRVRRWSLDILDIDR